MSHSTETHADAPCHDFVRNVRCCWFASKRVALLNGGISVYLDGNINEGMEVEQGVTTRAAVDNTRLQSCQLCRVEKAVKKLRFSGRDQIH